MKYHELLSYVSTVTGMDKTRSEKTTRAFFETLSSRLTNDEAKDLASQLPEELKDTMHPTSPEVTKLSSDEFVTRFAKTADISNEQARDASKALWQTLKEAVTAGEVGDVKTQLPEDLNRLFE